MKNLIQQNEVGVDATIYMMKEKKEEFANMANKGHWIVPEDITKYGLELVEDETYYCRQDGTCDGHDEYTHPVYGGCFHLGDCGRYTAE
jgi:hypothetical protein